MYSLIFTRRVTAATEIDRCHQPRHHAVAVTTVAGRSVEAAEVGSCSVVAAADPAVAAVVPAS